MRQTSKEYQNAFFRSEGFTIFPTLQDASVVFSQIAHISNLSECRQRILNDTNADWIILNDGTVAVHPLMFNT